MLLYLYGSRFETRDRKMYFRELGDNRNQTIIFLHGAFFTEAFGRQYVLIPDDVMEQNLKMYHQLQNKMKCNVIAMLNGMLGNLRKEYLGGKRK